MLWEECNVCAIPSVCIYISICCITHAGSDPVGPWGSKGRFFVLASVLPRCFLGYVRDTSGPVRYKAGCQKQGDDMVTIAVLTIMVKLARHLWRKGLL